MVADHVEGWDVAPGKIALSDSGYTTGASKSAIASDLAAGEFHVIDQQTGEIVLSKAVGYTAGQGIRCSIFPRCVHPAPT